MQANEYAGYAAQIDKYLHPPQDNSAKGEMVADIVGPLPGTPPTEPTQKNSRKP
jgi:hypothetical protein